MNGRPAPGDLVNIPEDSYMYGAGALTMRVREVLPTADPAWVQLVGNRVVWSGQRMPDEIVITAKVAAIKPARDSR